MRAVKLIAALAVAVCAFRAGAITEPETDTEFPETIEVAGKPLSLTGAGVRQVYGFDIYAIAHYADAAAAPKAAATAEEKLQHWIDSDAPKAMRIHFVFDADKSNMRSYAAKSLSDAGYTGEKQEKFLEVFARDYASGSDVQLSVAATGQLQVTINGKDEGAWDDPDLVRALWRAWLGENSPLKKRESLVALPEPKKE